MEEIKFNQVVSRGCGIDVHKKVIVAAIDGAGIKRETREFTAFTSSLTELRDWLLEKEVTYVAMESTGVYWKPVYTILEPAGLVVWVVNARHIKYVPGHKTDKKDSAWICKLLLAGLLKPSYISPKEQRELRDLTRYRKKLICQIASNKNCVIRILEDCNIKLTCVLSNTSGVVGTKLIDKLIAGESITMSVIDEVYHKKIQASKADLYEACQGVMTEHNIYLLGLVKTDISSSESLILEVDSRIKKVLSPYDNILELLKQVPGISTKSAEDIVAEIGLDMSVFPTDKHISSWAATRTKNTFYSARYHRLAARRGKKRALIAIGHSILKSVYHILSNSIEYKELGAEYVTQRESQKKKSLPQERAGEARLSSGARSHTASSIT